MDNTSFNDFIELEKINALLSKIKVSDDDVMITQIQDSPMMMEKFFLACVSIVVDILLMCIMDIMMTIT